MSCDPEPAAVQRVAVLGAGTMGHGIAQVCASVGLDTRLFDIDRDALTRARQQIAANLDRGVELRKVEPEQRDATLDRLRLDNELEAAVRDTQVVVEAVPERLDLKRQLLGRAASGVTADCLLASNTSSLSISAIAEPLPGPERVVGIHFFNPVHIMALVEVVRGDRTAERVVERARSFAVRLGKQPIVVRDSPGFASSRLGVALGLEAIRMVQEDVASAEDIDRAMELGYRHPMGPLRLTDLVGLDVRLEIARYLSRELGDDRFRPPELLERMVEAGKLGKKSGEGFYRWD
jgi:3-hydroxybutyryl-CoA dehydrogenase